MRADGETHIGRRVARVGRSEHATYIHRIRDALKSGSSARVRATMTDVMARMVP